MVNSKEFWIVFKHSKHWTQFFLKDGFGHCFILFRDDYNWCMVDPKTYMLDVQILGYPVSESIPYRFRNMGHQVIRLVIDKRNNRHFTLPAFVSCVTLVKYFLGIKVSAFTPYQLFKQLANKRNYKNITLSRALL